MRVHWTGRVCLRLRELRCTVRPFSFGGMTNDMDKN